MTCERLRPLLLASPDISCLVVVRAACLAEPLCCCSTGRRLRLRSTSPCAKLQSQSLLDLLSSGQWTSALVAGVAFRGALGKDRQSEVQVQMQVRVRVQVQCSG